MKQIPNGGQGRASVAPEKSATPVRLCRWASMLSNLVLCGACLWLIFLGMYLATEMGHLLMALVFLTALQLFGSAVLNTVLRRARKWPHTPRLDFYRFALALGLLPVGIVAAVLVIGWAGAVFGR